MEAKISALILEPAVNHKYGVVVEAESDADALKRRIFVAIRRLREQGDKRFDAVKVRVLDGNRLLVYTPIEEQE